MKKFLIRAISGIILAVIAVFSVLYLNPYVFKLAISVISALSIWELANLFKRRFNYIDINTLLLTGFLVSLSFLFLSSFLALLIALLYSFWQANKKWDLNYLSSLVFIFIYGGFLVSSIGLLLEIDRYIILILFATVWAGDTFAYFFGKSIGKHKLAPKLSPKKTWEGAVGSIIGSILFGGSLSVLFNHQEALIPVFIASIIMQIGDLFESFIKRQVDVKDSSNLIPGHGGILDRIDALIFASAVFLAFYEILKQ